MQEAQRVVMKLVKEQPQIIPKLPKIYALLKKGLPVAEADLLSIGVTEAEIATLIENGVLRKEAIKHE